MSIRQNIAGSSPYEPIIGFSRAVRVGRHIMVSGTAPVGADSASVAEQTERCLTIIQSVLAQAGATLDHVVRTRLYLTHAADWEDAGKVHGQFFGTIRPASTMVVVAALLNPTWRIEIEADALLPE